MPLRALRELRLGSPSWQQITNQSELSENARLEGDYSGQIKKISGTPCPLRPKLRDPPVDVGAGLRMTSYSTLPSTVPVLALKLLHPESQANRDSWSP